MAKKSTKKEKDVIEESTAKAVEEKKIEVTPTPTESTPKELTPEEIKKAEEEKKKKEEEEKEKQHRLESFRKAGEIFRKVVEYIKPKVVIGTKLYDLCEDCEKKIKELGGEIGFPANISINDVAAHYSAPKDDEKVIEKGDVVKVDLGVAIDGYLVDGAFTVNFNEEEQTKNLVLAVETAVMKGLSMIKPGVKTNEVGEATYKIIKGFGYNVIKDLNGHLIEQWEVHGHKEIPNIPKAVGEPFEEGEVFALECFATTGKGTIHATQLSYIFSIDPSSQHIPLRNKITRKIYNWVAQNKKTLPFSQREILKEFPMAQFGLRELTQANKLIEHRVLKEEKGAFVAQCEHTFMVTADGIERLT
jgi:methionyl aminopeptidase